MNDLDQAAREARNAYDREWRRNNREKVKLYRKAYWERKAQTMLSEQKSKDAGGEGYDAN